jgi:hypothetical protein
MIWVSRILLLIIAVFLGIGFTVKPVDFVTVLGLFGIVGVLGVGAELARLDRLGKRGLAGYSTRRISAINLGLGVLCALLAILAFTKDSYFVAALNALGAVILLFAGARGLVLVPNPRVESDAPQSHARLTRTR